MLVRGHRAPIVGAVCMDMITVDVSDLQVETGDEVVIIGRQGDERIDVREMAAAIGTIPYEVLCRSARGSSGSTSEERSTAGDRMTRRARTGSRVRREP